VLKWLREILILRNAFLLHYKDNAYVGSNIPMAKHAQLKLEIVFFVYLWSIDVDAVKTAMSCFSLFCEEAEIRFGFDEMAVTQLLPNHNVYLELSSASNTNTSGRNALQKKILSLLRKIEHPTQGNKQAWYENRKKIIYFSEPDVRTQKKNGFFELDLNWKPKIQKKRGSSCTFWHLKTAVRFTPIFFIFFETRTQSKVTGKKFKKIGLL
jgi:hypothetical protein